MKVVFAEARKKLDKDIGNEVNDMAQKLPSELCLAASLQFLSLIPEVKKKLEQKGKKIFVAKGNLSCYRGQLLGCDIPSTGKAKAVLFIGSGRFHALSIALHTGKPVFIWQPFSPLEIISEKEIAGFRKKRKVAVVKFLSAEEVGILVSVKPGQFALQKAIYFKKLLEKKQKKAFILLADTVDTREFENFSLKSWLNTACPNIILDSSIIVNIDEVSEFLK